MKKLHYLKYTIVVLGFSITGNYFTYEFIYFRSQMPCPVRLGYCDNILTEQLKRSKDSFWVSFRALAMATWPHALENIKLGRIRNEEIKRESQGPGLDITPRTHPYDSLPSAKPHLLKFPEIVPPSEVPTSLFWVGQKTSEALHIKPQKTSVLTGQIYFC